MSWLMNVPPIARAVRALEARAHDVWSRDRSSLRGLAAFGNRAFRIGFHTVRGIMAHRLGLQAAALTYYTVFAMVPMLVVALWILNGVRLVAGRLAQRCRPTSSSPAETSCCRRCWG